MALMIYPSKGMMIYYEDNPKVEVPSCQPLYDVLGEEGIELFRGIFISNNEELVDEFFKSSIITNTWPVIRKHLKREHCFSRADPKIDIIKTYGAIVKRM